jgi:hypothetical protein
VTTVFVEGIRIPTDQTTESSCLAVWGDRKRHKRTDSGQTPLDKFMADFRGEKTFGCRMFLTGVSAENSEKSLDTESEN